MVVRLQGAVEGKTLQFAGHLDTVHLPFVSSGVENGVLLRSGVLDMKGGVAILVELLREKGTLSHGSVLLIAHDHHEGS